MRLYHFIEPQYLLSSILKNQIKLSTIATLNDPYEMMPSFPEADGTYPPICRVRERMLDMLKNTGLLCMTASIESPVLWAHYAAKHRGVALEFEFTDEQMRGLFKVDCKNNSRVVIKPDEDLNVDAIREDIYRRMIKTKAPCWNYEGEYRWVFSLKNDKVFIDESGLFFRRMPQELKRIILGVNCDLPEGSIRKALQQVGFSDISIARARMSDSSFDVVVDDQ